MGVHVYTAPTAVPTTAIAAAKAQACLGCFQEDRRPFFAQQSGVCRRNEGRARYIVAASDIGVVLSGQIHGVVAVTVIVACQFDE